SYSQRGVRPPLRSGSGATARRFVSGRFTWQEKGRGSRGQTGTDYSIGQLERRLQALDAKRDLALVRAVDHRGSDVAQRAHLDRPERERANRRAPTAIDEVVGAETRELQLRRLDSEQVLDRLRHRPVAILGEGLQLAQLVFVLGERNTAVKVDLQRL